ncbi:hypothetical protein TVAG_395290 [Trichomonas vaginalis G3]|uniref:Uncharacterized protein n=1 Tax=Trichomonas vaginalis (strain ATCC PRA-98 / G3) TaxID=412133 RepID=A2F1B8_TRIV3|nr:hypothetical protein TVAGG3_0075350 [Trichomonas vaginalis G3]EAY01282.1 hypothetical protein TVAG_395290 [Trichomonas vaginalis G3]KAI5542810.1 hypothetical protein TVAGG3_0075350 [Trichomonas vaginalis G3]|eukprot:XP_001314089.1 hypothetical protein [Trichomonas vaginalis G3]
MDSENEYDEKWTTEVINLRPFDSWSKHSGKIVMLTHVSMAYKTDSDDNVFGILTAETWDESQVLCKLFRNDFSKPMKIVWSHSQSVYLSNKGNREITLVLLTKEVS